MADAKTVTLGHDIVLWLVLGLDALELDDGLQEQRDAVKAILWNADLVTCTIGLEPSCSLAARSKEEQ